MSTASRARTEDLIAELVRRGWALERDVSDRPLLRGPRPPLTKKQLEVLRDLRDHAGTGQAWRPCGAAQWRLAKKLHRRGSIDLQMHGGRCDIRPQGLRELAEAAV